MECVFYLNNARIIDVDAYARLQSGANGFFLGIGDNRNLHSVGVSGGDSVSVSRVEIYLVQCASEYEISHAETYGVAVGAFSQILDYYPLDSRNSARQRSE